MLPRDAVPKSILLADAPGFFELQIKTLFQHAWSEANHDLGYKPETPFDTNQKRLMAYTSAQAWGADREFDRLAEELGVYTSSRCSLIAAARGRTFIVFSSSRAHRLGGRETWP